jgi:hypothetical protein
MPTIKQFLFLNFYHVTPSGLVFHFQLIEQYAFTKKISLILEAWVMVFSKVSLCRNIKL